MMYFTVMLLVFCAFSGALTLHGLKTGKSKALLVGVYCSMVSFVVFAAIDMLGLPKPKQFELRSLEGVPVLSLHIDKENQRFYVWALRDGVPMTYNFPWKSEDEAEQVERQFYESETTGTQMLLSEGPLDYHFRESSLPTIK